MRSILGATGAVFAVVFVILVITTLLILIPVWVPISWLLKRRGLKGFHSSDGIHFGPDSFRRA